MATFLNVDKVCQALNTAKRLRESIVDYKKEITKNNCDKHDAGFNLAYDRFCNAEIRLKIISRIGYCGNSECSTAIDISDEDIFRKAFIKVLNGHFFSLLEETADVIEKDARIEKEKALAELDELRKLIEGDEGKVDEQ